MGLEYKQGNLFDLAPTGAFLLHACNCQGVWGSGIAKQFKERYPYDYEEYHRACEQAKQQRIFIEGQVNITTNNIICLYTSYNYGKHVAKSDKILYNTKQALDLLVRVLPLNSIIYSPEINAGLFKVPWQETEKLIQQFLWVREDVKWVVCRL